MGNIALLFISGICAYILIVLLIFPWIDNNGEIDIEKERKLTDKY